MSNEDNVTRARAWIEEEVRLLKAAGFSREEAEASIGRAIIQDKTAPAYVADGLLLLAWTEIVSEHFRKEVAAGRMVEVEPGIYETVKAG